MGASVDQAQAEEAQRQQQQMMMQMQRQQQVNYISMMTQQIDLQNVLKMFSSCGVLLSLSMGGQNMWSYQAKMSLCNKLNSVFGDFSGLQTDEIKFISNTLLSANNYQMQTMMGMFGGMQGGQMGMPGMNPMMMGMMGGMGMPSMNPMMGGMMGMNPMMGMTPPQAQAGDNSGDVERNNAIAIVRQYLFQVDPLLFIQQLCSISSNDNFEFSLTSDKELEGIVRQSIQYALMNLPQTTLSAAYYMVGSLYASEQMKKSGNGNNAQNQMNPMMMGMMGMNPMMCGMNMGMGMPGMNPMMGGMMGMNPMMMPGSVGGQQNNQMGMMGGMGMPGMNPMMGMGMPMFNQIMPGMGSVNNGTTMY